MDHDRIDKALRLVDRDIWIITAAAGERRSGLVASLVMPASIDPLSPVLMTGLAANHYTTELVQASGAFAAHLIGRDQVELVWKFALSSGRTTDKLAGVVTKTKETGSPIIDDCLAWFDCRVTEKRQSAGRIFFWADIVAGGEGFPGEPLRESSVARAATAEQKAALLANRQSDIEIARTMSAPEKK